MNTPATATEIPKSVSPLFIEAGWYPGRRVVVSAAIPVNHRAAALLAEFGGLTVGRTGDGDQPTVWLYGEQFTADHPSVYRYR
jgi:hypothetical protein